MLEERGGWAAGEGPKIDTEMTEAVIEVLAEASKQIQGDRLNPFKEQVGEKLPGNMERNFSGFFSKKGCNHIQSGSGEVECSYCPSKRGTSDRQIFRSQTCTSRSG